MYFLLSIFYRWGTPNIAGPKVTYPPTLPLDGPGCVNNVLINAF